MAANVVLNIQVKQNASGALEVVAKDLDNVGKASERAKASLGGLGDSFKFGAAAGASLAVVNQALNALINVGGKLGGLAGAASDFAEGIGNAAARTGIATDALQNLKTQAENAGLGFDSVLTSVTKMQLALEKSPKVFEQLGLDPKDLKALDADAALKKVILSIDGIGSASQRTNAYTSILGKTGVETGAVLAQAFKDGSKSASELGATLSKDAIAGLAKFDAATDNLNTSWQGLWLQLGSAIGNSPAVVKALTDITDSVVSLANTISANKGSIAEWFAQLGLNLANLKVEYFEFAKTAEKATPKSLLGQAGAAIFGVQGGQAGAVLGPLRAAFSDMAKGAGDDIEKHLKKALDDVAQYTEQLNLAKTGSKPGALNGKGPLLPTPPKTFIDPAIGNAAEDAALRAAAAWTKAAESARAAWDKGDDDMKDRGKKLTDQLLASAGGGESTKQMGARLGQQFLDGFKAMPQSVAGQDQIKKNMAAINQLIDEQAAKQRALKEAADAAAEALAGAYFGLADAFHQLGEDIGGIAGEVAHFAGAGVNAFASIAAGIAFAKKNTDEFGQSTVTATDKVNALANAVRGVGQILSGPGGAKGAAGGALSGAAIGAGIGSVFPGIGTLVGAGVGAVAGGILGLFGSGKKKADAEEVKQLQQQLLGLGGTMADLKKLADKFGVSLGNAFNTKKPQDVQKVIEQLTKAIEHQQKVLEGLGQAAESLTGLFTKLSPTTEAGAAAQATIFSTVFWATVKEKGYGPAIDALTAPFEALKKSLTEKFGPELTSQLLGSFAIFFDPKVKESISVFSDIQAALEGVSAAGYLTKGAFEAFGITAQQAFDQAVAGGLDSGTALQAIAPLLASIVAASQTFGFTIDANTQALIEQAKKAGIAFPVSPIERAATAMEHVADILDRIFGTSKDIDTTWQNMHPPGGPPDPREPGGPPKPEFLGFGSVIPAATGWGPKVVPDMGSGLGPKFQTHAGELVMIVPKKDVSRKKNLVYGDFGKADKGLGNYAGKLMQAASGFGNKRDDEREPRDRDRDPHQPSNPGSPGTAPPTTPVQTVKVVQAINQNNKQQSEDFKQLTKLVLKMAKDKTPTTVTAPITQHITTTLDVSQVASSKQAFLEEVGTHLAQGMKQGGTALGRAVEATLDKRIGRGRTKAS